MLNSKKNSLVLLMFIFTSIIFFSACNNSKENYYNRANNANLSNNKANSNEALPTPPSATDLADKIKIEEALKKEGFAKITVDISTTPPTLRGVVPENKMPIVILIAEKAAGKKLINRLNEK